MKKVFSLILIVVLVLSTLTGVALAEGTSVAKVGNTEYATIDEAIANWTNNSTLTLLADVTLTDVITLKSTEHHILNLGTYTMMAASGKNAFVIQACGTGSSERSAITINADATNPGGINAGSKCVVYYKYADGGIDTEDRPIIKINGGVFTGSTSSGTAGIYTIGTAARKCATLNITGGTFNCSINGSGKSKLLISGGTFNYSVGSQGDSTCYRLISAGTFKTFGFMTADAANKFGVGTALSNYDVGCYVDDDGYLVVGGSVITEASEKFEASSTNYSGWNSYLQYSSAKDNGLYYTSVEEAFADNNKTTGVVTVYANELDMTGISYKGTILIDQETVVKYPEGTEPAWKVRIIGSDASTARPIPNENGFTFVPAYTVTFDTDGGSSIEKQTIAVGNPVNRPLIDPEKTGHEFSGWYLNGADYDFTTQVTDDITLTAKWDVNQYTITFDTVDDSPVVEIKQYYNFPVSAPADPTKTGYTFAGWDKDIPATMPAENVIITAQWTINQYTIIFDTIGGSPVAAITQDYNTAITAPADPTMTGHTFIGWIDEDGNSVDIPVTMPAEDMALTACWSINTYTISFDTKGAGSIDSIPVQYGTPIPDLPIPFRQGYEFIEWLGIPADGKMPAENITLTATWRQTYFQIDPIKPVKPVTPVTPVVPVEPEVDDDSCDGLLSSGCAAATFADLDSSLWYHDAVDYVLENQLMQGTGGDKFAPYTTTSRAMIVTILYRLEGEPTVFSENPFTDVADDEWYTDAVLWAAENEIVLGYDGEFFPEDDVTLEQVLLILQRYAEYKGADEITVPMIAPYEYSDWAENGVVWAYLNGVLEIGTDLDDLTAPATRAELAGFLYAFCK